MSENLSNIRNNFNTDAKFQAQLIVCSDSGERSVLKTVKG